MPGRWCAVLMVGWLVACDPAGSGSAPRATPVDGGAALPAPLPVACGNGVVDGSDTCEQRQGCATGSRCTAQCTCEILVAAPVSSQTLIEQALERGTISVEASLLYRVWALFNAPELPAAYDGDGAAGEDTALLLELSQHRGVLPDEIERAVAPYLVRPNDPTSIYSTTSSMVPLGMGPPSVGCPVNAVGQPDWRTFETTHFVVWSCGGGVGGADPYAAGRAVTGAIAEQVWTSMTPHLGEPLADDYPAGPEPSSRMDIYLLARNGCREREGQCQPIRGDALAVAVQASPCGRTGGGPLVSSAYLLFDAATVPLLPPGNGPSKFRASVAHEFFHAVSFRLNLEAQGGSCTASAGFKRIPWLSEASAVWASSVFFASDHPARRTLLFQDFQLQRDHTRHGLHDTTADNEYQAFLYPFFIQEEAANDPQPMFDFWLGSHAARNREDLDTRLNALFNFSDHFRDFAVRNLNVDLPGNPLGTTHLEFDPALPLGGVLQAPTPQPVLDLQAPRPALEMEVSIAPLAAHHQHFTVPAQARSVVFDASGVVNVEHLKLDAIVNVGGTWRRERANGPVFRFCRDTAGQDIQELYLVFSNDDFRRTGRVDGAYLVDTQLSCPGGWSGTIETVQTLDEHTEGVVPAGQFTSNRHERETQQWTVMETLRIQPQGAPAGYEVEHFRTAWTAQRSTAADNTSITSCGTAYGSQWSEGSGSGKTLFMAPTVGVDSYSLSPAEAGHTGAVLTGFSHTTCEGANVTGNDTDEMPEALSYLISIPALTYLSSTPQTPGHFEGSAVLLHSEQPREGGQLILDITVKWNLTRAPLRD